MKKKVKKPTKKTRTANHVETKDDEPTTNTAGATTGRPSTVNYEEFVRRWKDADSVSDVAKVFGIKTTSASAIANRLRKEGVELKRFPRRGAQAIDVKKLNKIIAGKAG